MTTRNERLQRLIQLFKQEKGVVTVDMDEVAAWAMDKGVDTPKPKTSRELLAEQFAQAAREEHQRDPETGLSYRRHHAMRTKMVDGKQQTLWVELDDATRPQMLMSLISRRQQMVGDGVQLKTDELVWNNRNKDQEPIQLDMDFTYDVEERLNSPGIDGQDAA